MYVWGGGACLGEEGLELGEVGEGAVDVHEARLEVARIRPQTLLQLREQRPLPPTRAGLCLSCACACGARVVWVYRVCYV
jgi:hypothetical protein